MHIHDRMPVIIHAEQIDDWLNNERFTLELFERGDTVLESRLY